jgi:hypothetical protein
MAKFDRVGGTYRGTVTVDRDAGLVAARRLHCRRVYELPLSAVADFVCRTVLMAELRERRAARAGRR